MTKFYYLAYGSNLHPERLTEANRCPSANLLGTINLSNKKLAFHKESIDGSGKCNLYSTEDQRDSVWCALYEINTDEKIPLDRAEGKGSGYNEEKLVVELKGKNFNAIIYVATNLDPNQAPYEWYKNYVLEGAYFHNFPEAYISSIAMVVTKRDKNQERVQEHEEILERMKALV